MTTEGKFVTLAIVITLLLIGALTFLLSAKSSAESKISYEKINGVIADPGHYDLGDVSYSGGVVSKEYKVKNSSGKDIKLLKIATSCMCTTASAKISEKPTPFYGMEMNGISNPMINSLIKDKEEFSVEVKFDPASHGLAGLGQVSRSVELYFDGGMSELTFNGNVVNE